MRLSPSLQRQLEREASLLLRFLAHVLVVSLIVLEVWIMELLPTSLVLQASAIVATLAGLAVLLTDDAEFIASRIRHFLRDE